MKTKLYIVILFFLLSTNSLFSDVPNEIEYQGRLREFGMPVNGTRNMRFNIYSTPTEGIPVWSSGDITVNVSTGVFSCVLSPEVDWRNANYWLETIVENKVFTPRQKITSQVYSFHSRTSEDISKLAGNIYFSIGTSTVAIISNTGDFNVQGKIKESGYDLLPRGAIIMWAGPINSIPAGWALCDGTNGTPDLRDRFIVGAGGSYSVGSTGGANTVSLSVSQLPPHSHTISSDGGHSHNFYYTTGFVADDGTPPYAVFGIGSGSVATTTSVSNHSHGGSTGTTGSAAPIENRPPYYALAFIMKL